MKTCSQYYTVAGAGGWFRVLFGPTGFIGRFGFVELELKKFLEVGC